MNKKEKNEYMKEFRKRHLEEIREYDRMRYWRDRDKRLKCSKKWRDNNKELKAQKDREYRLNNKDKVKLRKHEYNISQIGKLNHKISKLKRREFLSSLIHDYTKEEWELKIKRTNGICPKCGKEVGIYELTLDHIIPISKAPRGFTYTINDVQPLCKPCNSKKQDKLEVNNGII